MTDYSESIVKNLAGFPGYVKHPERVMALGDMLNDLDGAGFGKLVNLFVTRGGDQARDILFEAWLAQMLRRNPDIRDLSYEPEDMGRSAPDFRFWIGDVRFDMQVKRLYAISNARDKTQFRRRFEERAATVSVPWFLNLWLSEEFARSDIDGLFFHIKNGLAKGRYAAGPGDDAPSFEYPWPSEAVGGQAKARFSFHTASTTAALPHLHLGVMMLVGEFDEPRPGEGAGMLPQRIDQNIVRNALDGQMDKARHTLSRDPGLQQVNLVVVQPESNIDLWMGQDTVADALYGDEVMRCWMGMDGEKRVWSDRESKGLFTPDQYRKMCGVIVVPSSAWPLSEEFEGLYFPHPLHLGIIEQHPKPFPEMVFHRETAWSRGRG